MISEQAFAATKGGSGDLPGTKMLLMRFHIEVSACFSLRCGVSQECCEGVSKKKSGASPLIFGTGEQRLAEILALCLCWRSTLSREGLKDRLGVVAYHG